MARRASARIRARNSATPQPQKTTDLLFDGQLRTPKTAPPLSSLAEADEMPGAFPQSVSPKDDTPSKVAAHLAVALAGRKIPVKPASSDTEEATPSRSQPESMPSFEFTFRAQSLELSSEARQMMAEKREEAARVKAQMEKIEEEKSREAPDGGSREIAQAKSKSGRFSNVHLAQFKKMDSIASHASAGKVASRETSAQQHALKRTGSKAGLRQGGRGEADTPATAAKTSSSTVRPHESPDQETSPAKRVRISPSDMVTSRSTQGQGASNNPRELYPPISTPTKSSLTRAATVKSQKKTMIPTLTRTPSKSASKTHSRPGAAESLLYSRSLTKFAHMSAKKQAPREGATSPLLCKSPIKHSSGTSPFRSVAVDGTVVADGPFLARSPARPPREHTPSSHDECPSTRLLSQSPTRIPIEVMLGTSSTSQDEVKTNLMDRFNLLRKSPIKSILRTPQRLYSNDPAKIASGTHLASPSVGSKKSQNQHHQSIKYPQTAPVVKHVDFSASTKSTDESPLPSSKTIIEPGSHCFMDSTAASRMTQSDKARRRQTLGPLDPKDFTFRAGTTITFGHSPSLLAAGEKSPTSPKPSIRHVSADPEPMSAASNRKRKFVEEDDVFSPARTSPSLRRAAFTSSTDAAISHPDSEPHGPGMGSDKENDANTANILAGRLESARLEDDRPAKRMRKDPITADKARTTTASNVPSWAQGTAAQRARAALSKAASASDKKPGTTIAHATITGVRRAPSHAGEKSSTFSRGAAARPSTAATATKALITASVAGKTKTPDTHVGKPASLAAHPHIAGGYTGPAASASVSTSTGTGVKSVLSRARLDALSQPKRR